MNIQQTPNPEINQNWCNTFKVFISTQWTICFECCEALNVFAIDPYNFFGLVDTFPTTGLNDINVTSYSSISNYSNVRLISKIVFKVKIYQHQMKASFRGLFRTNLLDCFYQNMYKQYYILIESVSCFTLMVTKTY